MPQAYTITNEPGWLATEDRIRDCFAAWGVTPKNFRIVRVGQGAKVRWVPKGVADSVELASHDQANADKNLHKLCLGIEALRMQERRGFASIASSYYAQTTALVEHESTKQSRFAPYQVLGLQPNATRGQVDSMVRHLQAELHKNGGDEAEATRINVARTQIFEERGW